MNKSFSAIYQNKTIKTVALLVGGWFLGLLLVRLLVGHGLVWDENWYESVLTGGYSYTQGAQSNIAFFPLYPLTIFIMSLGIVPHRYVAIAISFVYIVITCVFAIRLAAMLRKKQITKHQQLLIVATILCFPTAFFLAAMYVEALLALLVTLAIYLALKEKYLFAFLVAGFASGAKFTGVIAVIACVAILLTQNKLNKQLAVKTAGYIVLGISGLLLYMFFLLVKFHDPFIFFKVQETWGRTDVLFVKGLYHEVIFAVQGITNTAISRSFEFMRLLNIAVVISALGLTWLAIKQKVYWLAIFILAAIGIPLLSGSFDSISRYVLVALPVIAAYFVPRINMPKKSVKTAFIATLALSFAISLGLYIYFVRGVVFIA